MSYRDDLHAALSRADALEREVGEARAQAATARKELESLRKEKIALPRAHVVRLLVGLGIGLLALFPVVASWGSETGEPIWFELDAGPVAAVCVFICAVIIGLGGPLRAVAVALLAGGGALLLSKPWLAPVLSTWGDGPPHPHSINSETHYYFLIPGICLCVLAAAFLVSWMPWSKPRSRQRS